MACARIGGEDASQALCGTILFARIAFCFFAAARAAT
jgi:hypothetical protein